MEFKDSQIKKMVKLFNKYAKGLRKDGIYVIYNNMVISSIIDQSVGLSGTFAITYKDDDINYYVPKMMSNYSFINGDQLQKVLTSSGLNISMNEDGIVEKIQSKTLQWDYLSNIKAEKEILNKYLRYTNLFNNNDIGLQSIIIDGEFLENLIERKAFIIDITHYFDIDGVDTLKMSNKILKNFDKTTEKLEIQITDTINYGGTDIRLVKYIVSNPDSETESIYAFI